MNRRIDMFRKYFFHILFLTVLCFSFLGPVFCADYNYGDNPDEIESSARYNYYIGDYYYNQGRYDAAEQYFRRSRDLIERKNEVISERRVKPALKGGGGGDKLEYRIGDQDTLHITVWQNEDLTQDVTVRPDGKISFPLIGDVTAMGLTLTQLRDSMTKGLKEYIKDPLVSISVKRLGASKVIVLGQVVYPGVYGVSGRKTILEAIALAGGFTNDAVASSVILVRGGMEKPKGQRLDLNKPLGGKGSSDNLELESEDIVFVPKKFVSDVNYLINTVLGPMLQGAQNVETMRSKRW